jgi:hypothetical protein
MTTASPTNAIATLRIEVKYIEPLIWRRVAVRTSMNLMALHKVIQAAMGWRDYHLWEFIVDDRKYGMPDPDRPHVKNGATTQLATILASGMTEYGYVYDFGDHWEHRIVSSNKLPMPRPAQSIRGFWVVNVAAHLRIAAVHLAISISSKILPARTARKRKRRLIGTAVPMTPTILTKNRSQSPLAGSQTPADQGDQNPSAGDLVLVRFSE